MNIDLAEILQSIPCAFTFDLQESCIDEGAIIFKCGQRSILVRWYKDGMPKRIVYFYKNQISRPWNEGPAWQEWHKNGQLEEVSYMHEGKEHRPHIEGASKQTWYPNGSPRSIEYQEYGKLRPIAQRPAFIYYDVDGNKKYI